MGSAPTIWVIAALAVAGVILRPRRLPEAIWAVAGAAVLVATGLLPWRDALTAIGQGTDVYLFLIGMMLLAELARREGLFDWLAALATRLARGSARRLFALVYLVGIAVTVFLSNDATAVVLTPAVYAAATAARVDPLPYLFVCAFIANAASFVLPISNPANLVIFGHGMPPLLTWLKLLALPSALAILSTYLALRWTQRAALRQPVATDVALPRLPAGAGLAAGGIVATGVVLVGASAADVPLGLPTFLAGGLSVTAVLLVRRSAPWGLLKGVSWSVLPLVAGLFVLVAAVGQTGVLAHLAEALQAAAGRSVGEAAWSAGLMSAVASNLMNNLPVGLIAGSLGGVPVPVTSALLIGVDLGPNLSVTGSLATILWLVALRREGLHVGTWRFLRLGLIVMPPALALALAGLLVGG